MISLRRARPVAQRHHAGAYHWHALALTTLGRVDDAVAAMRQAILLDPLSVRMSADMGMVLYAAQRYDEAIAQERKALQMNPKSATATRIMGMALERSIEARSGSVRNLKVEPRLDPLRTDPRFAGLLQRAGLPR